MFILYQSNDFKILKHMFLYVLKKEKFNTYYDNTILVSNSNVTLKLKMFFSKYLDIFANYKFLLTAKFIWKLCKLFFNNISDINYFSKINLFFVILNILPKLINNSNFLKLNRYLKNDLNYNKLFNLCYKISDLYDKYLVYRPNLLINWENSILDSNINDDNQIWQSILWKKILNFYFKNFNCKLYRSKVLFNFLNILKNKNNLFKNSYNNIYIFNVYNLPPLYLDIIYFISRHINIHYFLINPSKKYWYDINNFFNINNNILKSNYNLYNSNLIILYYAKIFAEYLYIILNYKYVHEIKYFNKNFEKNILGYVKKNILYFYNYKFNFLNKLNFIDDSIIIKSCYGYLDEVYKLKKFLLKLIFKYNYKYNEIIVVITDIKKYLFYINLVFSSYKYNKILPYLILDKFYDYDNNYNFLKSILNIKDIDLNSYKFLNLLKNNIILEKFDIDNNELNFIIDLIKKINFFNDINNFDFDKKILNKINYKDFIENIKSLLLGYAINKKYCIWNNIYSYNLLDSNFIHNIIGKFSDFVFKILYWKNKFRKEYFLNKWIILYFNLIEDFFSENLIKNCYFLNKNYLNILLDDYKIINFNKKINSSIFIKIILILLKKKRKNIQFSINHINISSISYLRSLPFKIICILGLNLNIYPKNILNYNFDLMYLYPKFGDRNKIENDKYLFLENCILAQDKIYMSYISLSLNNNKKYFPSILLDNLLNYININIFNLSKISIKNLYFNVKNKKKLNNNKQNLLYNNFYILNKTKNNILLKDFCKFWFDPIKFFFNISLKIFFYEDLNYNLNNLNYNIKDFYIFKNKIVNDLLIGNKFNKNFYLYLQKFNLIPLGNFGKILWKKEMFNIIKLFNYINNISFSYKEYKFSIIIKNIFLNGTLSINNDFNHFKYLPKNLNLIDGLLFWIDHLIYCCLGFYKKSILYGYNNIFIFNKLNIYLSKDLLYYYINGFLYGIKNPLLFFPKLSDLIFKNIYNFKEKKLFNNYKIIKSLFFKIKYLIKNKNNNYVFYGLNNVYINYLIKNNYIIDINLIISNSKKWLLPMLKYMKIKKY